MQRAKASRPGNPAETNPLPTTAHVKQDLPGSKAVTVDLRDAVFKSYLKAALRIDEHDRTQEDLAIPDHAVVYIPGRHIFCSRSYNNGAIRP